MKHAKRAPQPCAAASPADTVRDAEYLALAVRICAERGGRLTALRRRIVDLMRRANRPLGAYDLLEALRDGQATAVGPPTVYRALNFLMAYGLVTKIESRNAYVLCAHPTRDHHCLFFICTCCGTSIELEDAAIEHRLIWRAGGLSFNVSRSIVEVEGTCGSCTTATATPSSPVRNPSKRRHG